MKYEDSVDQAAEYARLALPLMTRNGIAANPVNYAVWYAYVSGKSDALREAIDRQLQRRGGLDAEISEQLFLRYIGTCDPGDLERSRADFIRLLNDVAQEVIQTGDSAAEFQRNLDECSNQLGLSNDVKEIRDVVGKIINETQRMGESGGRLKEHLQKTSEEVESLRRDLERIQRQAATDGLSGLYNRRSFDERLNGLMEVAREKGTDLCLVLADIDHFKRVNDSHGHIVGDKVIKFVATTLERQGRGPDVMARFGGEEFAAILPATNLPGARIVAERVRSAVAGATLKKPAATSPWAR